MEVISDRIIKATKNHKCGLCGETIPIGTLYCRQFNKDDSGLWRFDAHRECMELMNIIDFENHDHITEETFNDVLHAYSYENHYDDVKNDVATEWLVENRYEAAKRTLKELQESNITHLHLNI